MKSLSKHQPNDGFSLVELLVVIAVIGVIAAIAIPAMSGIFENSGNAKARRNAQSIASMYSSLRAAGASVASPDATTIAEALTGAGVNGTAGTAFSTTKFRVPMGTAERDLAVGMLTYETNGDVLVVTQP